MFAGMLLVQATGWAEEKAAPTAADQAAHSGKKLGVIFNNDSNNILWNMDKSQNDPTPEVYRLYVERILDCKPGLLAQDVGFPEGVIYPTKVDTDRTKYWGEICKRVWPESGDTYSGQTDVLKKLFEAGTDPLKLTIEACRARGVPVVASYRMNAEDLYEHTYLISDFGRDHPEYRIPGSGCLDWAIPAVYEHRMKIFAEVVSNYDIDGIEFDFRRWYHMVSNPLENHKVLTRLVRETRKMLDEAAKRKGRQRLILGVRVSPMLEGDFAKADFPGSEYGEPTNVSCRKLGLDVKTWVDERLVDYICPALFSPLGLPKTKEFVALVKGSDIGVYPTISFTPTTVSWDSERFDDDSEVAKRLHREAICKEALQCYDDGADGVSLFNWFPHLFPPQPGEAEYPQGSCPKRPEWSKIYKTDSRGFNWVLREMTPKLSDPAALREMIKKP